LQAVRRRPDEGRTIRRSGDGGSDPRPRRRRRRGPGEVLAKNDRSCFFACIQERPVVLSWGMAKGPQTRERILDTAFRLAARDGLEGLSLSALAAEIGLSKSGLFAHFTSKEELQLEMLRVASERFVEEV